MTTLPTHRWILALAVCPPGVVGDLTGDGITNIVDIQCGIGVALSVLAGASAPPPCMETNPCAADADCNGTVNIADVTLAMAVALGLPLPPTLANEEGCPWACAAALPGETCPGCAWLASAPCKDWLWTGEECAEMTPPQECDDCNVCTTFACDSSGSCSFVPVPDGTPCPIDDLCIVNPSCKGGWCVGGFVNPNCVPQPEPACTFVGAAGEERSCTLLVARWKDTPPATALQASWSYSSSSLELLAIESEKCFPGVECVYLSVMGGGGGPLASGHSVSVAPASLSEWNSPADVGGGAFILVNLTNPLGAVSTATASGFGWPGCISEVEGSPILEGKAEVLRLRFKLKKGLSLEDGPSVNIDKVQGAVSGSAPAFFIKTVNLGDSVLLVTGMGP